jgi:predicted permease
MHNPDQLALLIAFMVFTFVVMAGMSWLFAKWMKRHKEMEQNWTTGPTHGGNDHHH